MDTIACRTYVAKLLNFFANLNIMLTPIKLAFSFVRRNHDNLTSLDTVTKIVACIADLNKMGFIMQYGLLKNSHGENEECLNIDSIDIDFLEEEIK